MVHWELRARRAKSAWGGGTEVRVPLKAHLSLQCPQRGHHLGLPQAREEMLPGVSAAMTGAMP